MEVQAISNTIQKFNGESFYLCGYYFQRKGKRLHRTVWEYHNGEIPDGYDIHHIDGNRANNDISNLQMLDGREHESLHMSTEERKALSRECVKIAIAAAPAWHHSEEGLDWHAKHAKKMWENRGLNTYVCTECGKEFQTRHIYKGGGNRFCHLNCRAKYGRRHRANQAS